MENDDANRTIFNIPEENYSRFEEKMAKLSRRSVKLIGTPIEPVILGYHMVEDEAAKTERRVFEVYLAVEVPKIAGWSFVARLDHSQDTGTIIRAVPNIDFEIDAKYRECEPNCDHCNHRRQRRDTFLLRNDESGDFKQIGSTCLRDFLGHDPAYIARMAEYFSYASEIACANEEYDDYGTVGMTDRRFIPLENFLQHCAAMIEAHGWISGGRAYASHGMETSTRTQAMMSLFPSPRQERTIITDEHRAFAKDALEWARSLADKDELSDYEHNVQVIANAEYINYPSTGLAASIVGVHHTKTQRGKEEAAKRKAMAEAREKMKDSAFVGAIGERVRKIDATVMTRRMIHREDFSSCLFKFLAEDGSVFTWFCSGAFDAEVGNKVVLSGTVKKHNEYEGTKETQLTNCRAKVVEQAA